ncbi:MAG TPA: hypothetical protein VHD81_04800 [Mycobacteriales bacterium]|nr:hypothetical protein [Mycobacteriales bacterium]
MQPSATVCMGCGLAVGTVPSLAPPAAPAMPVMPAPAMPPVENPWRSGAQAEQRAVATSMPAPAPRYGVPQPVERPAEPIMPPNPFAKGAQTDRGLPPQMPVRHESASIPVAFAQFSQPEVAQGETTSTQDHAEVVVLHRGSLAEALEAALADLPEDAPDHLEEAPEPFPEVLSIAPPKAAMPGWS